MDEQAIKNIVNQVMIVLNTEPIGRTNTPTGIPVGVSNRHIHLTPADVAVLFGEHHQLTNVKDLTQTGQFAAEEQVTLVGPKGILRGVRVLGPTRKKTQIEISRTDSFMLGIKAPLRESGDINASAGLIVTGPLGAITLTQGVICAARHIHMTPDDAKKYKVHDGQRVMVENEGERGVIFKEVLVRVRSDFGLEFHIDTDEANAAELKNGAFVHILER